jgi:hypothetical protein
VISIEERNKATASWKDMMEKDFDLYYTPGINSPSPEMRTATAMEYAAYQLGQINHKLDRMIAALGSTAEATPPILTGINADCDRVVGIMSRVFTAQDSALMGS